MHVSKIQLGNGYTTYESVAGNANILKLLHPSLTFLRGEGSWDLLEDTLKSFALRTVLRELATDEQVDGVALVRSLGTLLPLDAENTLMEAHPPVVGLITGKSSAMNSGLLASTETNNLAIVCVAHRVALGVLKSNGGNGQIASGALWERSSVLRSDDCAEVLGGDLDIVAVLLEVDAVDGAGLGSRRVVFGVDLKNKVSATLLLLEDLKSGILVARSNNTIGDLLGDDTRSRNVNNIAESDHIAKAAHAIGSPGTSIGLSEARLINTLDVMDKVDLLLVLGKGQADGSTSGRDVLEAGSSRLAKSLLEFLDQRPGVKGVEEVDIAG